MSKSAGANHGPFLIISRHDFRTERKANIHFIASELAKKDKTRFFSFGFSLLSKLKHDPRVPLWSRADRVETVDGVDCYLWRTLLHPVNLRQRCLAQLEAMLFRCYRQMVPDTFRQYVSESKTILFESGLPIILVRICKCINPQAHLIYIASDSLKTISCSQFIIDEFSQIGTLLDAARLPSRELKEDMPPNLKTYFIPQGIDKSIREYADPSPFSGGINAVTVGSMLFDASFFEVAARQFPRITFHIIGGGVYASRLSGPNIKVYPEMPFRETIPYIRNADFGIAPYDRRAARFMVDTSLKLLHFGFLGVPAVCPHIVAGCHSGRFGYEQGNPQSIADAINSALAAGHVSSSSILNWSDVADRIVSPDRYADTRV